MEDLLHQPLSTSQQSPQIATVPQYKMGGCHLRFAISGLHQNANQHLPFLPLLPQMISEFLYICEFTEA
jgi:hypothetical protein